MTDNTPGLTDEEKQMLDSWYRNQFHMTQYETAKRAFAQGILHARAETAIEASKLLNEQGMIMQKRIKELEAEVEKRRVTIKCMQIDYNEQVEETKRLAKALSKES